VVSEHHGRNIGGPNQWMRVKGGGGERERGGRGREKAKAASAIPLS